MTEMKSIFDILVNAVFGVLSIGKQGCEKDHFCRLECREYKERYCC